jgi:hypothetical protein
MPTCETIHVEELEKAFTQTVIDLQRIIVLDEIQILPDDTGFRIRCHDRHGPLPELLIGQGENRIEVLDRVRNRACWLYAIVGIRRDLKRYLPGCRLLPATTIDGKAVVGLKSGPLTFLEDGEDFLAAYHMLRERVFGITGL